MCGWIKMVILNPYSVTATILVVAKNVVGFQINAQVMHEAWSALIILLFVMGSFSAWEKEHRQLHPFRASYKFCFTKLVMHDFGSDGCALSLWVRATNQGGKSSIPEDTWRCEILHGGRHYPATMEGLTWDHTVYFRDRDGNERGPILFDSQKELVRLLTKPLDHRESENGILRIKFPQMPFATLEHPTTRLEIACNDVDGNLVEVGLSMRLKDVPFYA